MHAIKDCDHEKEVCDHLVSPQLLMEFLLKQTREWIIWMTRRGKQMQENRHRVGHMLVVAWLQWR